MNPYASFYRKEELVIHNWQKRDLSKQKETLQSYAIGR